MEVKSVLKQTITLLQKDELLETTVFDGTVTPSTSEQKDIDLLVFCLNNVLNMVATEYVPILEEKEIVTLSGSFLTSVIGSNLLEIKKIEDESGLSHNFKLVGNNVETDKGILTVTYSVLPEKIDITSTLSNLNGKISERILSYGTATEFLFVTSEFNEAAIWENRFKSSLETACRKTSEIKMPRRRWL